jgi:hypothetical protein
MDLQKNKQTMKVTSNKTKRAYTILLNGNKYRTIKLGKSEFEELYYNTEGDWINYIKSNEVIAL